jgi:hypothetical protein
MKLVLAGVLFEPLQLFSTKTGVTAKTTSTQRYFIPMLILGRKVSNREGQAFKFQRFIKLLWPYG